jgi:hypothetical protein
VILAACERSLAFHLVTLAKIRSLSLMKQSAFFLLRKKRNPKYLAQGGIGGNMRKSLIEVLIEALQLRLKNTANFEILIHWLDQRE